MIIRGVGDGGGVSSVVTADGARGFAASCVKDYPHKRFKMAQVNHKQNISTKTYHFRGCVWGKSYRTIVAGTQQMDGTWKHLKKWWHMSTLHKKSQQVYKKRYTWAYSWTWRHNSALLQSVALKRREEEKNAWVNVALIWIGWNRITAQAKRKISLLSHTPANRNECPCGKHFLTIPAHISVLSLSLKNQNFNFVTLIRAPSQPVALFFYFLGDPYKPISLYCTIYENYR